MWLSGVARSIKEEPKPHKTSINNQGFFNQLQGCIQDFFLGEGKIFHVHAQYTTHEGLGTRLLIKRTFFYYLHVHVCLLLY